MVSCEAEHLLGVLTKYSFVNNSRKVSLATAIYAYWQVCLMRKDKVQIYIIIFI